MRDKLIELILDYCTAPGKFPYKADELKKYTNEYLLELLEESLDKKNLNITAVDNTYSDDDILFGGPNEVEFLYGKMEFDPLFPSEPHYSDWDGGDASITNSQNGMPAFDINPFVSKPGS